MEINKKEIKNSIEMKYETQLLSTKQVSEILNVSTVTLGRWKKQGINLRYKQNGGGKNAPIFYPIDVIVNYIIDNNVKII